MAAVDVQAGAGDQIGPLEGQEGDHVPDGFGPAKIAGRNVPWRPTLPLRITTPYRPAHENADATPGDRVVITAGKYAGHTGKVKINSYQGTVDSHGEWFNGHHIRLGSEELVTTRWEQVEAIPRSSW